MESDRRILPLRNTSRSTQQFIRNEEEEGIDRHIRRSTSPSKSDSEKMNEKDTRKTPETMTFNETLKLIGEFLEVAFHQILHLRNVYPTDLFEQRKKFNVPVMSSRHPVLTSYIGEIITQSMEEVTKGLVSKLVLAIQDNTSIPPRPLEHFIFDLQYLIDPLIAFENETDRDIRPIAAYGSRADAELHVRAFLIKLNSSKKYLGDISINSNLTWTTFLELNDKTKEPISETSKRNDRPPQWTPCDEPRFDPNENLSSASNIKSKDFGFSSGNSSSKKLIPLKSQGLGMIQLQMLVIQHKHNNSNNDPR